MGSASKFYNQRIVYLDSVVAVVEEQYHHEPIEHESYSDVVLPNEIDADIVRNAVPYRQRQQ